ncbi:CRISPR-associated protein Cas4 [bacterium]|nr:CRISPR-associated protein Cas4 [bacterium]
MIDEELISISLLSNYYFCKRRTGFLLLEDRYQDNEYTSEGTIQHEIVHSGGREKRGKCVIERQLYIQSKNLGIHGFCDYVEFYYNEENKLYEIYPIEYKHGVLRDNLEYQIQLTAQAMCLEETFNLPVKEGAIFYINSHRRFEVDLDENLRNLTLEGINGIKDIIESQKIPLANYSKKCKKCAFYNECMPKLNRNTSWYIKKIISECENL